MTVHSLEHFRGAVSALRTFQARTRDTVRDLERIATDPHITLEGKSVKVRPLRAEIAQEAARARQQATKAVRAAEQRAAEHQPTTLRRRAALANPGRAAEYVTLFSAIATADELEAFTMDLRPEDGKAPNHAAAFALAQRAAVLMGESLTTSPETYERAANVLAAIDSWSDTDRRELVDDVTLARHAAALVERAVMLAEGRSLDTAALWGQTFAPGTSEAEVTAAYQRFDEQPAILDATVSLSPGAESALAGIPSENGERIAA